MNGCAPYLRRDSRPLTGWHRARFVLALWRHGYLTVRSFQRQARLYPTTDSILQDGVVGPQTWTAFWVTHPR